MVEEPIITPSQFLSADGITTKDNQGEVAIVAFCPFYAMKEKAGARPLERSLFVHIDVAHQFKADINGQSVLMVDCVYGGPVCATLLEEMAYLGVKRVVGYGYSGSLRRNIAPGTIVIASSGIISDGTSREYCEDREVAASAELLSIYERLSSSLRFEAITGRAWTTDAIYREYPSKVRSWAQAGADFVNMDTSHFYCVSRAVGIEAIYFSLISDYVSGDTWHQGFSSVPESINRLQDLILRLIAMLQ